MNLEKLKDQARKFEHKEEWRRAIEVYLKAIDEFESGREPTPDLSLYNRIGDLYMKAGDTAAAVKSYERAVDLYADQGFYNNAIALCSKILRVQPARSAVHLRLAYLHAHKNVLFEAKRHLVEYLERMNAAGQREDGLGAMAAFADQFAGNPDIRMMLVELLTRADRTDDAIEQLRKAIPELEQRGDIEGLQHATARLRELDPDAAAPTTMTADPGLVTGRDPLVFLDTGTQLADADDVEPVELEGLTLERTGEPIELDPEAVAPVSDLDSAALDAAPEGVDAVAPLDGLVIDGSGLLSEEEAAAPPADLDLELEPAPEPLDLDVPSAPIEGLDSHGADVLGLGPIQRSEQADLEPPELLDLPLIEPEPEPLELEVGDETQPGQPLDFELVGEEPLELAAGEPVETEPPVDLPFIEVDEAESGSGIAALEDRVLDDPADPDAHLALGQALADAGYQARAVEEFELAITRYEERADVAGALGAIDGILALRPEDVRYHQKAVELAFHLGDRPRLLAAYQGLGTALAQSGEGDKAIAVFRRVLEHDPGNAAAQAQLAALQPPAPPPPVARPAPPAVQRTHAPGADFVDLGSLVLEPEGPRDTRMKMEGHEEPPTSGDEQRDFEEMLDAFKRGIDANLGEDDHQAHYDLGIAFKEMGLLDEAIEEFQKALRGAEGRLRTAEALGQSFFEKGQYGISETVLRRALEEPGGDDEKIGVIYWLGRACEAQGKRDDAAASYERALAVDIRFMDLSERVHRLASERRA